MEQYALLQDVAALDDKGILQCAVEGIGGKLKHRAGLAVLGEHGLIDSTRARVPNVEGKVFCRS